MDGAQLTDKSLDYIGHCRRLRKIMIEFCTNFTGSNFSIFQVRFTSYVKQQENYSIYFFNMK